MSSEAARRRHREPLEVLEGVVANGQARTERDALILADDIARHIRQLALLLAAAATARSDGSRNSPGIVCVALNVSSKSQPPSKGPIPYPSQNAQTAEMNAVTETCAAVILKA